MLLCIYIATTGSYERLSFQLELFLSLIFFYWLIVRVEKKEGNEAKGNCSSRQHFVQCSHPPDISSSSSPHEGRIMWCRTHLHPPSLFSFNKWTSEGESIAQGRREWRLALRLVSSRLISFVYCTAAATFLVVVDWNFHLVSAWLSVDRLWSRSSSRRRIPNPVSSFSRQPSRFLYVRTILFRDHITWCGNII